MRKLLYIILWAGLMLAGSCRPGQTEESVLLVPEEKLPDTLPRPEVFKRKVLSAADIRLSKNLLFDRYTLEDTYPYRDTVRTFKWETIRKCLAFIENMQHDTVQWVVFQNYKNLNREAPLVRTYVRNAYGRLEDTLGVERYQSVPLYHPADSSVPERYGRDGSLASLCGRMGTFHVVSPVTIEGKWLVPPRYVKLLADTTAFHHVVVVDRQAQHIATLQRVSEGEWTVCSMNPATTGMHRPPYAHETPLGMFVLQEKKTRMVYLQDGGTATGGYAPYASRFTNGAYIHGVPVNVPRTAMIEYSPSLGTTPRSHMCVRNATSHAKFIFDHMPTLNTLIIVIE